MTSRLARDAYGTPLCLRENREAISALVPAHIEDARKMADAAIAAGDSPSFFTAEWIAQTARVLAKDAYRKERDRELLERANVSEVEIVRILGGPDGQPAFVAFRDRARSCLAPSGFNQAQEKVA